MDITFLVGNGFDLSLGYKTSYKDFYKFYLKQPNNSEHKQAIAFLKNSIKKDLKKGLKHWSDFESGLGRFTKKYPFECSDYLASYNDAIKCLNTYLSKIRNKKIDFNSITEMQWDEIRKNLCLFYLGPNEQDNTFFNNLKRDEQNHGNQFVFHFVSFNYTNYLDEYIEKIAQKPLETWKNSSGDRKHSVEKKVFHVHGPLSEHPIMGVSKEEQILNPDFLKDEELCTVLIKKRAIEEIGSQRYSTVNNTIEKSRIVCLWGLSIGASDDYWWTNICNWLGSDPNRYLYIFEHTDDPPNPLFVSEEYEKKRKVAYRMLNYSKFTDNEKKSLLKRIYVSFNNETALSMERIIKFNKMNKTAKTT